MKPRSVLFRAIFGIALILVPLHGDGPSQAEPRMIDLNVVALDSHGQPVADLTRDELRVTDSGQPLAISFFHFRDGKRRPAPQLGPNEFSNRTSNNIPRATLILFDQLNQSFGTGGNAANQLIHELGSLETADYLYLYFLRLDGRLFPVHGLPAQGEFSPPNGVPWTRQIKQIMNEAMRETLQARPVDIDVAIRVQLTFFALDAIAAQLAVVPGHKNIVWVTDGVPIELGPNRSDTGDYVDFTPLLRRMSDAYDRAGVAIYPVRQLLLGSPSNIDGATTTTTAVPGIGSIDTLHTLAEMTGGRPDAGKDIGAAVRQAISDARTSYQIGYYPPEKNWDDKYHKVRVTCTRKGVRIQAKAGYYGWREAPGTRAEEAINSAISPTFDAAEIGIRASLSPDPKGGHSVRLEMNVDAEDVAMVPEGDRFIGQLRFAVVAYTPGDQPKRGSTTPLDFRLTAQEREKVLREGIRFAQNLPLPESMKTVRVIVYDRESNAIGSVTLPVPEATPGDRN